MDIDHIKNRILEFLRSENITSAQFAQEIGVQPSGISHIISGRNKPSLDFIVKMVLRYPSLSTDWLLLGKGPMYREGNTIELFQGSEPIPGNEEDLFSGLQPTGTEKTQPGKDKGIDKRDIKTDKQTPGQPGTSRIVIFNADGTFSEHFPV